MASIQESILKRAGLMEDTDLLIEFESVWVDYIKHERKVAEAKRKAKSKSRPKRSRRRRR